MCGIFGVINFDSQIDLSKVVEARDTLSHRGPDDAGIFISKDKSVVLANRRLSIIDLSDNGHQPMTSGDGRYTIVYNGEIYNYKELMQHLASKGYIFKSKSDTEVILYLYAHYREECVGYLRGMFAFAIWDEKENTLFAARDRFGIKPFYYLINKNEFVFSSELKAIKKYRENLTLNYNALTAFLLIGSIPAPLTLYNETEALMPGKYLILGEEKFICKSYWSFCNLLNKDHHEREKNNKKLIAIGNKIKNFTVQEYDYEAKRIIKETLIDTIRLHLVADVEVGVFLSGGIDSTALISLMRQAGVDKIKTITIVFPDTKFDEAKYARLVAKRYKTNSVEIPIYEKDFLEELNNIFYFMDQPTIDGVNTYFVSKAAKQAGLKVVLSGLGGDELFGGYPSFKMIPKFRKIKNLPYYKFLFNLAANLFKDYIPTKLFHYLKNPDELNSEYKLIRGLFTIEEIEELGFNAIFPGVDFKQFSDSIYNCDCINNCNNDLTELQFITCLETSMYMSNQLLRDSDVFSMANSVELRVPFVDHKLFEIILPYIDNAFNKKFPKRILCEAVSDLPEEIINRSKMGFTFPFEDWIKRGKLKEKLFMNINNNKILDIKIFSIERKNIHWSRVWALFVLKNFLK